jgi:glycosyltransferase involved in cell wall biosynthesis
MKFTITTSFYNGKNFIEGLYLKIKEQTYTNWEWIVTDDFSDDNGKEVLINLSKNDRRVKYVNQTEKKEMFWNPQNFCKDSEIIVQLDQDDYPLPKALEVYHYFFTKFPETILITCSGNIYDEVGNWKSFYYLDYRQYNNMSSGHLTFLRAWRNNPNILFDFNPNNMKYFYNDLSIVCGLEEHGKVLNLPRNLYRYTVINNSISHKNYDDITDVRNENENLIYSIKNRRYDNSVDTLNRYFEPIYEESLCFVDYGLNDTNQQRKISFYSNGLNTHKINLLKELFYDFDLNFNKIDGDEDCLIYNIIKPDDIDEYSNIIGNESIKLKQLVIHYNKLTQEEQNEVFSKLNSKYVYSFQIYDIMVVNIFN